MGGRVFIMTIAGVICLWHVPTDFSFSSLFQFLKLVLFGTVALFGPKMCQSGV